MSQINQLVLDTGSPPIPDAQAWIGRYAGGFGPAINLSQAVPSAPPHPLLMEQLAKAGADPSKASYGPIAGDDVLRQAYAADLSRAYGAQIHPAETAITSGCNQAFVVTMMALAGAGSAVILPSPWYFNHKMTLDMLGIEARVLTCQAERGFVPAIEDAANLIDSKVRAIVLVTPNNPTGAIYPPETIRAFYDLCRVNKIWLVLDETYRDFMPEGGAPHALFGEADWRETVIQLYSFSKAYCIPGYRLGAVTAGEAVIMQLAKVLDCVQICPARVAQAAIAWSIPNLPDWRDENRREMTRRAAALEAVLDAMPGWQIDSIGAYFAYVRHPLAGMSAAAVAEKLASERGVLCLPGSYFSNGAAHHLRVAFANADAAMIAGLRERFAGFR